MWNIFNSFLSEFLHLTMMVLPFFITGIAFGALLESTVKFNFIYRHLNQGKRSILYATFLGGILPGCACATVPMAEGLRRRGAKIETLGAFMLTSPLLAPQTVILTYGFLGLKFTLARILFAIAGGLSMGLIFYILSKKNQIRLPEDTISNVTHDCCEPIGICDKKTSHRPSFFSSFISITKKLGGYFLLGMVIASILTEFVPIDLIPKTIGQMPILSYLLATIIGVPLYICEGEEIPIAYSLIALGFSDGPALTFMLGAVGTCIPTLLFAKQLLGKKALIIYGCFWIIFAPLSGYIFSYF